MRFELNAKVGNAADGCAESNLHERKRQCDGQESGNGTADHDGQQQKE
jgi:hypothetical protein